jgi:DNA-binding MarR family transcriptional regulator
MAVKVSSVTVDATSLPGSISYLLWRTQSELARAWQRLGEHELTRHLATFDLLTLLASFPGISPSELARALVMDKSNTATLLRTLQRRRWLARRSSLQDARSSGLFLTPEGVHQLALMRRAYERHEQGLIAAMGESRAASLVELLRQAIIATRMIAPERNR